MNYKLGVDVGLRVVGKEASAGDVAARLVNFNTIGLQDVVGNGGEVGGMGKVGGSYADYPF